jgi:hypothetical protein
MHAHFWSLNVPLYLVLVFQANSHLSYLDEIETSLELFSTRNYRSYEDILALKDIDAELTALERTTLILPSPGVGADGRSPADVAWKDKEFTEGKANCISSQIWYDDIRCE